jgi:hypothetical protein
MESADLTRISAAACRGLKTLKKRTVAAIREVRIRMRKNIRARSVKKSRV